MEPTISVGILSAASIDIDLLGDYHVAGTAVRGPQTVSVTPDGRISWSGQVFDGELLFTPASSDEVFEIKDVVIGVNFHWERRENQRFSGSAKFIVEDGKLTIINILPVEDYLLSVISSEMSAHASLELLKAHAVISRSWLLAQIDKNRKIQAAGEKYNACTESADERIKWYDREDHVNFDVCADDHCQRYQGVTRQSTPKVAQAINATRGQVLMSDGELCDARFSKCCGGVTEEFQYCWENTPKPYLRSVMDANGTAPDLSDEATAEQWIRTSPTAFCNTTDKKILAEVLNDYDRETPDFYRWRVEYTQEELAALIKEKTKDDFGRIVDLVPLQRGKSGRICRLKIEGTKKSLTIGKELEIRRTLSQTHLYSSAFVVDREMSEGDNTPKRFILTGAGWGHGVGLCQIGAAMMSNKGYDYDDILLHYYRGAEIKKLYE